MKSIIIMSGKGGVGKTTIAVNLALSFSFKFKTGLLDIDIHGPNVPILLNLENNNVFVNENNKIIPINFNDNLYVMSLWFLIEKSKKAVIWRGPLKSKMISQFINDVAWNVEYLIVDFPPGTGDEIITFAQLMNKNSKAIIVSLPNELSLSDAERAINFCKSMNIEIIGLIENMSSEYFGKNKVKELSKKYSIDFLGSLPLSKDFLIASEKKKPVILINDKIKDFFNEIRDKILSS